MCLAAIWLPCSCRSGEATGDRGTQATADSWVRRPWRWLQTLLLLLKLCRGGEGRCRARPAELSPDDPGDHQNPISISSGQLWRMAREGEGGRSLPDRGVRKQQGARMARFATSQAGGPDPSPRGVPPPRAHTSPSGSPGLGPAGREFHGQTWVLEVTRIREMCQQAGRPEGFVPVAGTLATCWLFPAEAPFHGL